MKPFEQFISSPLFSEHAMYVYYCEERGREEERDSFKHSSDSWPIIYNISQTNFAKLSLTY
jgi:hypothetical protein